MVVGQLHLLIYCAFDPLRAQTEAEVLVPEDLAIVHVQHIAVGDHTEHFLRSCHDREIFLFCQGKLFETPG